MTKPAPRLLAALLSAALLPLVSFAAPPMEEIFEGAPSGFFSGFSAAPVLPEAPAAGPKAASPVSDVHTLGAGYYLTPAQVDLAGFPPAPAAGSETDQADMKALFDWQRKRTAAQCAEAREETEHSYKTFFGRISPFPEPPPESVKKFFHRVGTNSTVLQRSVKDVYKRERPFLRDPGLRPCALKAAGYAYPSGHAMMARVFARILGDLVPERKAEFMARADEAALNRVVAGVHHLSDVEAGKILGDMFYSQLLKHPVFAADLEAVRSYITRAKERQ